MKKMKKTTALFFAALLAIVPLSAQATAERPTITISSFDEWVKAGVENGWIADGKIVEQPKPQAAPAATEEATRATEQVTRPQKNALVIVDAYFDSSKISGNVVDVCIAVRGCELIPPPSSSASSAVSHGTAMAELARKANPEATLYLVRAASSTKNTRTGAVTMSLVNGNDFLNSLKWVQANIDKASAVSFSYRISSNSKPGDCKLSSVGGVNVAVVDPQIRSAVAVLKDSGVPVFAATGNDGNRKPVDYPACISDVASVAAGVGGGFLPLSNHDANTDYVGSLPANTFSYTSSLFGLIPQTTSSATVSVAALWSLNKTTDKWVSISR
jgi:hypothetical protein